MLFVFWVSWCLWIYTILGSRSNKTLTQLQQEAEIMQIKESLETNSQHIKQVSCSVVLSYWNVFLSRPCPMSREVNSFRIDVALDQRVATCDYSYFVLQEKKTILTRIGYDLVGFLAPLSCFEVQSDKGLFKKFTALECNKHLFSGNPTAWRDTNLEYRSCFQPP